MEPGPFVSIITPVLNGARYLEECIFSVLHQSYPFVEQVFVDGGSTDGTVDIIRRYQTDYPGRLVLLLGPGKNACEAWNTGWSAARGDILGWLGADDRYKPDAILNVVRFFAEHPDAYFVYGGCEYIDKDGKVIRNYPRRDFDLDEAINHDCYIPTTSAFYRKGLIERVGSLDTTINLCDRDYFIRAAMIFKIQRIDPVLSCFRLHEGGITGGKGHRIYARELFLISQRYGARFLSLYRTVYYARVLVDFLRPVFGPLYPYLRPFVMNVAYPFYREVVYPSLMRVSSTLSLPLRPTSTHRQEFGRRGKREELTEERGSVARR